MHHHLHSVDCYRHEGVNQQNYYHMQLFPHQQVAPNVKHDCVIKSMAEASSASMASFTYVTAYHTSTSTTASAPDNFYNTFICAVYSLRTSAGSLIFLTSTR